MGAWGRLCGSLGAFRQARATMARAPGVTATRGGCGLALRMPCRGQPAGTSPCTVGSGCWMLGLQRASGCPLWREFLLVLVLHYFALFSPGPPLPTPQEVQPPHCLYGPIQVRGGRCPAGC